MASSLAEAESRGPGGRLSVLSSKLREAEELRGREAAELASLGEQEQRLRSSLGCCEALAAEVAAAEATAKEVAARVPGARQLLTTRNAERARLREQRREREQRKRGNGGSGGVFLLQQQQQWHGGNNNNNNNDCGWR